MEFFNLVNKTMSNVGTSGLTRNLALDPKKSGSRHEVKTNIEKFPDFIFNTLDDSVLDSLKFFNNGLVHYSFYVSLTLCEN